MHCSLSLMHWALSSFGSAETHRGEDAVTGSRMPTLLFFAVVPPEPLLLLLQPAARATASATAAAMVKTLRGVVRIAACSFLLRRTGDAAPRCVSALRLPSHVGDVNLGRTQTRICLADELFAACLSLSRASAAPIEPR